MTHYQFCWYGLGAWRRLYLQRFEGGLAHIYVWRLAIGPLDIRRWVRS